MKLNENGDFCLLYVELADEKQSLFETIGAQRKPVVLMLPMTAGQSRARLFQRPEDFSDLKHLKRQTGLSIIFLTAGSELLAQMAARYGFPAYPSIDAFAETLTHGRRLEAEASEHQASPRRARTGPLVPTAAQIAAIKRAMPSGPLPTELAWPGSASPFDPQWSTGANGVAPKGLNDPQWSTGGRGASPVPQNDPQWSTGAGNGAPMQMHDPQWATGAASMPMHDPQWSTGGRGASPVPQNDPQWSTDGPGFAQVDYADFVSLSRAPTSPILPQLDLAFWESAHVDAQRNMSGPVTPTPSEFHLPTSGLRESPLAGEDGMQPAPRFSEVPPRRSAMLTRDPHTQHPGWETPSLAPDAVLPTHPLRPQPSAPLSRTSALRSSPELFRSSEPVQPPPPRTPPVLPQRRGLSPVLIILSLLILGGAAVGSLVAISRATPSPLAVQAVGSVTFVSSGQLNDNTSQGIDDEVQITLHDLGTPAAGKSYYAWLLGDISQSESQPVLLGGLKVVGGSVDYLYKGDGQHTNLLQIGSRFLITEESSSVVPLLPSPDVTTWRYYGAIPSTPDPNDAHHYSFLDHLRHLLADEPILDELELPGGLNSWFTRNTEQLVNFTTDARDNWQDGNLDTARTDGIRILSYLDGMSFLTQDMPAASLNTQITLDTHLAALGLLNVKGPNQNPGSYMDQIVYHLNGLINSPDSPGNVHSLAAALLPVMSNVTSWLQQVRTDDKQLLAMNETQLAQPQALSLLNDMVVQAGNAYTGGTNPSTGQLQQGVVWLHQQFQALATINISVYTQGSNVPEMGPSSSSNNPALLRTLQVGWKTAEGLL